MIKDKIIKIKKYLLFISILLFIVLWIHLIYSYIYSDSKYEPIPGWNISEALIWEIPSLNPLKPLSWNENYVISLLYRNLLRYDIKEKRIVWDLANCDTLNLREIKCYLKDNLKWSNWESISINDVLSTYKILKNTNVNSTIYNNLINTEISEENWIILFKSSVEDTSILKSLLVPIVPEVVLNKLDEKQLTSSFSPIDWIYSWKFKITSINTDQTLAITSMYLSKNENYENNDIMIDNLVLKIFENTSSFLKHKDLVNIFNDKNWIIWESVPRFSSNKYSLPQYEALFLNSEKLKDNSLRSFILNNIDRDNLVKKLWEDNNKPVLNPYLTDVSIDDKDRWKNIEAIMKSMWYYKKPELLELLIDNDEPETSSWTSVEIKSDETDVSENTSSWSTSVSNEDSNEEIDYWWKSLTIVDPNYIDKYNFISKDNILLKWTAWKDIKKVLINDYELSRFSSWDNFFYYRLWESIWTLKEWENVYKIYFDYWNWKELQEELIFYYFRNKDKLNASLDEYLKNKENKKEEVLEKEEIVEVDDNLKEEEKNNKKLLDNQEIIKKVESLEDHFFYNDKFEKFSLNLTYINAEDNILDAAEYIKSSLESSSLIVNLRSIGIEELQKEVISEWEENYDMLLTGIDLWYFDYDIYTIFHSSQSKNWFNFSNIKTAKLDTPLEQLKTKNLSEEEIEEYQLEVLNVLKDEQIIKVLYSPVYNNLIWKKILNYSLPDYIPKAELRKDSLANIYINEKKIISENERGLINFLKFLLSWNAK